AHRENDFHEAVGRAITAACEPLLYALRPDRPEFRTEAARNDHPCGEGRLALGIQTLLTAGHRKDAAAITAALDELRRRNIVETYSLASAILAIDAFYAPAGERDALRSGALVTPVLRQPSDDDRRLLGEWTARLRGNRDVSAGQRMHRWTYLGGAQY